MWLQDQPITLRPALIRLTDGDVEVAYLLQRIADHTTPGEAWSTTTEELAAWAYVRANQVQPILDRAVAIGLLHDDWWGPAQHHLTVVVEK